MAAQKLLFFIFGCILAVALAESTDTTKPVEKEKASRSNTAKLSYNPPAGNFLQFFQWGERQRNDKLLYKGYFTAQVNQHQDQVFPQNLILEEFNTQTRKTYRTRITQVVVFNKIPNESRTTVELTGGGPGWSAVNLSYKVPRGLRADYQIDIYGY